MYPGGYEAIDDRGPKILTNPQVNLPAGWNTLPGKAMDVVQDISDFILLKKDSYVLGKNLEAAGYARPEDAAAHHMVASGSRNASAEQSRALLDKFGIKVNDAVNGVFLPDSNDSSAPGANHRQLHTKKYYDAVLDRLQQAQSKQDAIEVLNGIRDQLLRNRFPK